MEEGVCKGSLQLGTGCKKCSRCFTQLEEQLRAVEERLVRAENYISKNSPVNITLKNKP